MNYEIKFNKKAKKFIEKQSKDNRIRIYKAIANIPNGDIKKMTGFEHLYRLRVGSYRIIYYLLDDEIVIEITDVDNRGDVYKRY